MNRARGRIRHRENFKETFQDVLGEERKVFLVELPVECSIESEKFRSDAVD